MSTSPILDVQQLSKVYHSAQGSLTVLREVSFTLETGATCAVIGPSGSGKTTLLSLCAGLDRPSAGAVLLHGFSLALLSEEKLATLRNTTVGFIFQTFQLLPTLTALENVMVPAELQGDGRARTRAVELLRKVGLVDRLHHYPVQLSGGEQQRVALARAFICQPRILFADEPTGNLDAETSETIVHLLFELNQAAGTTLLLVTHNMELARRTRRIIHLKGGAVVSDTATSPQRVPSRHV
jgi:putative ABC transport system ATP-binding protein